MKGAVATVAVFVAASAAVLAVVAGVVWAFDRSEKYALQAQQAREREALEGECHDMSTLLATTAGSPNGMTCPNRRHRMRVTVTTTASNEEAAALVFCECQRDGGP